MCIKILPLLNSSFHSPPVCSMEASSRGYPGLLLPSNSAHLDIRCDCSADSERPSPKVGTLNCCPLAKLRRVGRTSTWMNFILVVIMIMICRLNSSSIQHHPLLYLTFRFVNSPSRAAIESRHVTAMSSLLANLRIILITNPHTLLPTAESLTTPGCSQAIIVIRFNTIVPSLKMYTLACCWLESIWNRLVAPRLPCLSGQKLILF